RGLLAEVGRVGGKAGPVGREVECTGRRGTVDLGPRGLAVRGLGGDAGHLPRRGVAIQGRQGGLRGGDGRGGAMAEGGASGPAGRWLLRAVRIRAVQRLMGAGPCRAGGGTAGGAELLLRAPGAAELCFAASPGAADR